MKATDLLADGFGRVQEAVHDAVADLGPEELNARLDPGANSVFWLVWHLTRVQDDHIADASGREQVWTADGWADRFALPFPPGETGFGHSGKQVAQVRGDAPEPLLGYFDAVHEQTLDFLGGLSAQALERVVDPSWDPPVTLGVRLVSVLAEGLQHAGQAAFVRGVLERR